MDKPRNGGLQKRKCSRLLLFPLPFQGHITPMLQLAEILHSKGFSITIIQTKLNALNPENYPTLTFRTISDGDGLSNSNAEASAANLLSFLSYLNSKYIEPFECAMSELLADTSQDSVDCLISDALLFFTRAVAERFSLPRLVLRTSGISSFRVFPLFPLLLEKGYFPVQDSRLDQPIQELPPLRVKDLPTVGSANLELVADLVNKMVLETKASSGIIWNSFKELEQPALDTMRQLFCIPIFPIGPFHKYFPVSSTSSSLMSQDKSCFSWLGKQALKSVIYASFGSIAQVNEGEFLEIAWGLANSMHPFLLVVRPGLIIGSEWEHPLPTEFLEMLDGRGRIVQWAPQHEVLAHPAVGAIFTHNGWNSTLESICEGVPMICMPRLTDQLVNARYVTHVWQVGVTLDGLDRGKIEQAVKKLMKEKEGEEIRERMLRLKEKATLCLKPGGSSNESLKSLLSYISSP